MDINPHLGKIYAAGEHNYIENNTDLQYEDDVAYITNQTTYVNKSNPSQIISSNDIEITEANNNYQRAHPESIEIEFTGYPMN